VTEGGLFGPLDGFGDDARRALDGAAHEAKQLGHPEIGTEHLLLGLMADDGTNVARALRDAGASLAAARHKVDEAVGGAHRSRAESAGAATKRASRAVEGAVRVSHQRRAEAVAGRDLLVAVLNVEGRAGQVLRGLGVDVDALRSAVEQAEPATPVPVPSPIVGALTSLRCPSCGDEIGAGLDHRVVAARGEDGSTRDASVFSCRSCGAVLGVSPA
jgi:ATP-dependent Clp protease ATP-binding subunit ClpC